MDQPQAKDLSPSQINKGQVFEFSSTVSREAIDLFSKLSGDFNPLHCDETYATSLGYDGPVAHGVFQLGLVSQSLGMWVIGKRCFIASMQVQFLKPLVYPSTVKIQSEIKKWSPQDRVGQVSTRVLDQNGVTCFSETLTDVTFHQGKKDSVIKTDSRAEIDQTQTPNSTDRPLIVLTGATSGAFYPIIPALSEKFDIIAIGRRQNRLESLHEQAHSACTFETIVSDLLVESENLPKLLDKKVKDRSVWGVIHAAASPPPKGSLIDWHRQEFLKEVELSNYTSLMLARWLKSRCGDKGGRLILIGSNYAIHNNPQTKLLKYGIIKSLLVSLAQSLAFELAKDRITVNVVSPDYMPVGMNAEVQPRLLRMMEAAHPTKSLCQPEDLLSSLEYLLSSKSSFISGQELILSGGAL